MEYTIISFSIREKIFLWQFHANEYELEKMYKFTLSLIVHQGK